MCQVRVVMNKADSLNPTELLKISSALTWQLSRILRAPEVRRDMPMRHRLALTQLNFCTT